MIDGSTHKPAPLPAGLGFENESFVQTEDFDFGAVDMLLGNDEEHDAHDLVLAILSEGLREIFARLLTTPRRDSSIAARVIGFAAVMNHPALEGKDLARLAREMDPPRTRAAMSAICVKLADEFGLNRSGARREETRNLLSEITTKTHWRKKSPARTGLKPLMKPLHETDQVNCS
jgi:hypothetical protein